jgi:hypothetical protein
MISGRTGFENRQRERMLDALVRFTMGGLPALTLEHQSLSSSNETNEPTQEQSIE